jgi:hypothetical protein
VADSGVAVLFRSQNPSSAAHWYGLGVWLALAIQSHKSALDYKMDGYSIWVIHGILSTLEEGVVVEVLQLSDDGMYLDDVDSEKQQSLPPVQIQ